MNAAAPTVTTPYADYRRAMRLLRWTFRLAAQDIFQPNFRRSPLMYAITTLWLFAVCSYIVTTFDGYYENAIRFTAASLMFGSPQVTTKYYLLGNLGALFEISDHIGEIHRSNETPAATYHAIARKYSQRTRTIVEWSCMFYYGSLVFYGLMGAVAAYMAEQTRPIVMVYLPGVHEYGGHMLAIMIGINVLLATTVVLVMPPGDILFFVIFDTMPMIAEIVQQQTDEYSKMLRDGDRAHVRQYFMRYIDTYQKYNRHVKLLDRCFFIPCIIQFFTATVYVILAISVMSTGSDGKEISCAIAIVGLFQIIAYCVLGTIVLNSSDQIYNALASLEWNYLPLAYQKKYQMLLQYAQRPQIISIAGVKPLNMDTCLSTIKGIYSYAMIIANTM